MNFYVPTIGDKIYLTDEWHFILHQERRNRGLAERLDLLRIQHHVRRDWRRNYIAKNNAAHFSWLTSSGLTWVPKDHKVGIDHYMGWQNCLPTDEHAYEHVHEWDSLDWIEKESRISLPRGTELTVDRIYIRGRARDFDSITWRITNHPTDKKLKKARFWTKLRDANRIKCDLFPIDDTEAPIILTNRLDRVIE